MTVDTPARRYDDLQDAVDAARDGATITVEGVCRGSIRISSQKDLVIQGPALAGGGCPPDGVALAGTVRGGNDVFRIRKSKNVLIRRLNIIDGSGDGVELEDSKESGVRCSCIARNADDGIDVEDGKKHEFGQNLISSNRDNGIILKDGEDTILAANTVEQNHDDGIELVEKSDRNVVAGNLVRGNREDGIDLDDADKNELLANVVTGNGTDPRSDSGIELRDSDRNAVDGNVIRMNADGLTDEIRCQRGSRKNFGSNVTGRCGSATPAPTTFTFLLTPEQEVPPADSRATGECTAVLDAAETELSLVCNHSVSAPTAAHVHRGLPGVPGPVVFDLRSPRSPIQVTWRLSPADVEALIAEELYVNIHSAAFRDGEIRGQIE